MQQVIRLLGDLGERYGAEHVYQNLRTPADAIKLLCINYPEFQNELLSAHEKGIGYRVLQADVDLTLNDLRLPIGQNDLILAPVVSGADDNPFVQAIVGVALIGAAFFTGGATIGLLGLAKPIAVSSVLGTIGATMVLGSVTQMLSPQPEFAEGGFSTRGEFQATRPESVNRGADGQQSYAYLGAQNTVGVGATIPVAYGKVLIGSHVISADVDVADESDPIKKATRTPSNDTVTVNGNKLELGTRRDGMARWNFVHFQLNRSSTADVFTAPKKDDKLTAANNFRLEFTEGPTKSPDTYFVVLEVVNLFREVSGPGTTKTDGFISYMIESRRQGTDNIHARESFTIQGLSTSSYRYYHKFDPNKGSNIDFYNLDVTILDASVSSSTTMRIRHGFNPSFG
jgi:predicted phage tail protein|tara:strand:- start:1148 stop:2344 length:1197 start_codon:yes stop_codon:yes gene_type:complete